MYRRASRFGRASKKNSTDLAKGPTCFFSVFNPHTGTAPLAAPAPDPVRGRWLQIGSIDPGILHFGLRCERWYEDDTVETIHYCLIDFTKPKEGKIPELGKENFYYINSIALIEEYCASFLAECQYICIESQLPWAYDMVRLSSHIICILCVHLKDKGNRPLILELDARLKSGLLGAPSGMKKKDLKAWCAKAAKTYFLEEGDTESIDFMEEMARVVKDDDVGDVKCQLKVMEILHIAGVLPKIQERSKIQIRDSNSVSRRSKFFPVRAKVALSTLAELKAFSAQERTATIKTSSKKAVTSTLTAKTVSSTKTGPKESKEVVSTKKKIRIKEVEQGSRITYKEEASLVQSSPRRIQIRIRS